MESKVGVIEEPLKRLKDAEEMEDMVLACDDVFNAHVTDTITGRKVLIWFENGIRATKQKE